MSPVAHVGIFLALALAGAWAPDSARWRRWATAAAGLVGLAGCWRYDWPGLPLGEWRTAAALYVLLALLLLAVLRALHGERWSWQAGDELTVKRVGALLAWAALQQSLLLGFLMPAVGPGWAVAIFVMLHAPNWWLMGLTLAGGVGSVAVASIALSVSAAALCHAAVSGLASAYLPDSVRGHMAIGWDYLQRLKRRGTWMTWWS